MQMTAQTLLEVKRLDTEEFATLVRDSSGDGPITVVQDEVDESCVSSKSSIAFHPSELRSEMRRPTVE
jgi:hypothetical protein